MPGQLGWPLVWEWPLVAAVEVSMGAGGWMWTPLVLTVEAMSNERTDDVEGKDASKRQKKSVRTKKCSVNQRPSVCDK